MIRVKFFGLLIACAVLLGLTACGGDDDDSTTIPDADLGATWNGTANMIITQCPDLIGDYTISFDVPMTYQETTKQYSGLDQAVTGLKELPFVLSLIAKSAKNVITISKFQLNTVDVTYIFALEKSVDGLFVAGTPDTITEIPPFSMKDKQGDCIITLSVKTITLSGSASGTDESPNQSGDSSEQPSSENSSSAESAL
jgi:hypothetical protein